MDIQTQTDITVSLSMSEKEARAILVDPRPFQKTLRAALAGVRANGGGKRGWGGRRRSPKERSYKTMTRCPKCGKLKDNRSYVRHVSHCRGTGNTVPAAE